MLCGYCRAELIANTVACERCALPLGGAVAGGVRLCPACLKRLPPWRKVTSPFVYEEGMGFLIARWKYDREEHLGRTLAELWLRAATRSSDIDCLIPVPLHWRRLLQRGFNQSAVLAAHWSAAMDIPMHRHASLIRTRPTPAQAQASRAERLRNLRDVFQLRGDVTDLRIALVDDVCTTGATAEAAALTLRKGGAESVELWCLARTP